MAYHLPALQPAWSFVAPAHEPHLSADACGATNPGPAVQGWSLGPDGRPRMRWNVRRPALPGA